MLVPIALRTDTETIIARPVGFENDITLEVDPCQEIDACSAMRKALDIWARKHGGIPDLRGFLGTWHGIVIEY
jgi:hypothetical protein